MKPTSVVPGLAVVAAILWVAPLSCGSTEPPEPPKTPAASVTPAAATSEVTGGAFADVTAAAGVSFLHHEFTGELLAVGAGAVVFDFDDDGDQDLYVADSEGPSSLFRNDGNGAFTDVAAVAGLDDPHGRGNGGCAADYDNDGDQDLYATNYGSSKLYANDGDGTFSEVTGPAGIDQDDETHRTTGCAWGDYDRDGHLDLVVARHIPEEQLEMLFQRVQVTAVGGVTLFRNRGDGTFEDTTPLLGDTAAPRSGMYDVDRGNVWGAGFQPGWVDFDNDGDPDLYVVNDMGPRIQPNVLWRNEGLADDGFWSFADVSTGSGADQRIDGMALAVGDYDLDGFLDFYMTDIGDNVLLKNNGDGARFTDTTKEAGVGIGMVGVKQRVTWGAMFFDYDNDGLEDLYVVSGHLRVRGFTEDYDYEREQPNVLLRNNGDGTFTNVSRQSGADDPGIGRGGVFLDFDDDGCLDLFVVNYGQRARLFRNECDSGNNWLVFETVGTASNRNGIGARITVESGGRTQIREVSGGSSHMGQNMLGAHFGLGKATVADSVKITWPSGVEQTLTAVAANQRLRVTEPE